MPVMDQVVWLSVNIAKTGGATESYARGSLLPPAANPEEAAARNLLRIGGAIRTVEVVYTPEELADAAGARAEAGAARAAALDTDQGAPSGAQMATGGTPGLPTLESPGATPVVIGPEPPDDPPDDPPKQQADPPRQAAKTVPAAGSAKTTSTGKS